MSNPGMQSLRTSCWAQLRKTEAHARLLSKRAYAQSSHSLYFYRNKQLELWASKKATPLSLRQLMFYGRQMSPERLINSANYVRTELPIRIAHRIRDMQSLPYIVVTQEMVSKVYELYWEAFEKIRTFPQISNLEENERFCEFIQGLLDEHSTVIAQLALGLSLSSPYLTADELDHFFRRMLVSRISRRVICQHHVALSNSLAGVDSSASEAHIGIIYNHINIKDTLQKCIDVLAENKDGIVDEEELKALGATKGVQANWPIFKIDGHLDTTLAYIKEHIEYVLFQLLKNAARFSMLRHAASTTPSVIRTTIISGDEHIFIRISDQGGGVTPDIGSTADLFSFSHLRNSNRLASERIAALRNAGQHGRGLIGTVAEELARKGTAKGEDALTAVDMYVQRIGLGLPLSNIFATYFGGSLELVSLEGWGLDVYIQLPRLGRNLEGIEL